MASAARFERIAALRQGIADTYDMAYGLIARQAGTIRLRLCPLRRPENTGAGAALRLTPGQAARGVRFRHAQSARLVRWPRRRNLLHRQSGRLGRDQQVVPHRRWTLLRLAGSAETAHHQAGRQDDDLGAVRLGPFDQRSCIRQYGWQVRPICRAILLGRADVRRRDHPSQCRKSERRVSRRVLPVLGQRTARPA